MAEAIGYLRVSTRERGRSGWGLAAQHREIEAFSVREGISVKSWQQDVQTGAGTDALQQRPRLAAALNEAKSARCPLIVSKLDRLSRNVHFITVEHRVHFIVAELGKDRDDFRYVYGHRSLSGAKPIFRSVPGRGLAAAKAKGKKLGQATRSKAHQRRVSALGNAR